MCFWPDERLRKRPPRPQAGRVPLVGFANKLQMVVCVTYAALPVALAR
ncbi:hypothetical protein [Emticicia sp. 17c]